MLGNPDDAEDLTQEVFLQLFRKADTFRGEASFSTWLHRLTINTVLMQMRRFRRWRGSVSSLDVAPNAEDGTNEFPAAVSALPAPATSPMDKISLDVAIDKLSSGYKEIFLLHDLEGYRHEEIAKRLGISEGTSKSQLHKARLRLRDLVQSGGHRFGKEGAKYQVSGGSPK
jgi:RNA polymerase sigma-70 factor (ECF subfamily)